VARVHEELIGQRYRFLVDRSGHDEWVAVFGGGLPSVIDLRIEPKPGGRYAVTGLRIGVADDARGEINSETLRDIRLADILADYYDTFQPETEAEILATLAAASVSLKPSPPTGRGRPAAERLQAFAKTYAEKRAGGAHGAMTAAAKAHNISRATADRWVKLSRKYGYLPKSTEEESSS
jgi:hypothetical protein